MEILLIISTLLITLYFWLAFRYSHRQLSNATTELWNAKKRIAELEFELLLSKSVINSAKTENKFGS